MKDRCLCIHGHFYQPPRENPWLETIEVQDSAEPYHDWNERIAAECYLPNSAARILDKTGKIREIVSNYRRMSFNFGPTLLSWMEIHTPEAYAAILQADRESIEIRSGHGNAIAQAYNHIIMPMANSRDKRTQVLWGIRDFAYRFQRSPEGMWLPEAAVDSETLDMLAQAGILFTILTPRQALRTRKIGTGEWIDVSAERIDPTRAYLCTLPSGRSIALFFADGPVSRAVAFEQILSDGEQFAKRLIAGLGETADRSRIMNIATDGESYGHHHKFGDMALAYALDVIESSGTVDLTNYGEYLAHRPPEYEVEIAENSSWSCAHGVERWKADCGCSIGSHPGWNQKWRVPLRNALDWLRDEIVPLFESRARDYLVDPWKARDEYIEVILRRTGENIESFLEHHGTRELKGEERAMVFRLLEMQRHVLLMYTSCGWFFDDLTNIETIQVLRYAGRAIQLAGELGAPGLEEGFRERIAPAESNKPGYRDGAQVYDVFVKSRVMDLKKVAAHYAVRALFERQEEHADLFSYKVIREQEERKTFGAALFSAGTISVSSKTTLVLDKLSFFAAYSGDHAFIVGVCTFPGDDTFKATGNDLSSALAGNDFLQAARSLERQPGMQIYSIADLFLDEQRKVLRIFTEQALDEFLVHCRLLYERNRPLMDYLLSTGVTVPAPFVNAAGHVLNHDLGIALGETELDAARIQDILHEMQQLAAPMNAERIEVVLRGRLEHMMRYLLCNPGNFDLPLDVQRILGLLQSLGVEVNAWQLQNIYYRMAKTCYRDNLQRARSGEWQSRQWLEVFREIGESLSFNVSSVLPKE